MIFTAEQRLRMYLGELLDNNDPNQITESTPQELVDKILSDYENTLEVIDEVERLGIDMKELRKEYGIDV
ncbi:hypothetical protein O0Z71_06065 [Ligilactobacillus saerimneri]|uniref:hypothetical protein n=1 Tax=Ligilactobacillus saerimneri TaxID=228229 RepID=UPI0022A6C5D9|nr:hypothetical protein [Ligilactobacillus saerimneri]MCZ0892005.1 hypothetical protein [Ligilactobacillus saerimneri]